MMNHTTGHEKIYRSECIVLIEIKIFYPKQYIHYEAFFPARLLSVAKNSALCVMSNNMVMNITKKTHNAFAFMF